MSNKKNFYFLVFATLLLLICINTKAQISIQGDTAKAVNSKLDSFTIKGSVGITGLVQTGDENRTVATLLSIFTFGNHKYEIEPLTSIAYSTKPGKKIEEEYLENIIVRYHQENKIYPALGLSFEKSFLRKINYRYSAGITVVANLLRTNSQIIKLGVGYNHEFTQYITGAFTPPIEPGNNYYGRNADQVYIRLKGKNHLLKNKLIVSYDFFYQPSIKDFADYRWTLIGSIDIPITKRIALRASTLGSYETFVATNVSKHNFRLTYGVNISF